MNEYFKSTEHTKTYTDDLLRADPFGDAGPSSVNEPADVAPFGAIHAHDRHLGARVDEGFHRIPVHPTVDVEHRHL